MGWDRSFRHSASPLNPSLSIELPPIHQIKTFHPSSPFSSPHPLTIATRPICHPSIDPSIHPSMHPSITFHPDHRPPARPSDTHLTGDTPTGREGFMALLFTSLQSRNIRIGTASSRVLVRTLMALLTARPPPTLPIHRGSGQWDPIWHCIWDGCS